MSLRDYSIYVMDTSGIGLDVITPIGRIQQLRYTRILNDIGDFEITLINENDRAFEYWQENNLLFEIYRRNGDDELFEVEQTYLKRYADVFENPETGLESLILGGLSLEDFLATRIINPDDDPTGANGFSTKSGFCDAVMSEYVDEQCVNPATNADRVIEGLSVAPTFNIPFQTYQRRKREDNLLQVLKDISQQAYTNGVRSDFKITRQTGATFLFEALTIGNDRSFTVNYPNTPFILFDPKRGNLSNPRLTIDRRKELTFAYVAGQGPEQDRAYIPVIVSQANDSKWNRREGVTDSRENSSFQGLLSAGYAYLQDNVARIEFSFEPDFLASQGKYNVDWFLGDVVSATYIGFQFDYRITKVTITVTQDNEKIEIQLDRFNR